MTDAPDRSEQFPLGNDRTMWIRPTNAEDAGRLETLYASLPTEDKRLRFFTAFSPHPDWCRSWASVGERGGFGVIATVNDGNGDESVAGEAGYATRPDGDGDLAVTIAPEWRGWLGSYLLDRIVEYAAQDGVANLQADILVDNVPMRRLLEHRGAVAFEHPAGTTHLSIATTGHVPSWPADDDRRRVLVEVAGGRWAAEPRATEDGLIVAMCSGPSRRKRFGCPVLTGARCPLADGADAIVVLLDPEDESTEQLVAAHAEQHPATPVFVRPGIAAPATCETLSGDTELDLDRIEDSVSEPPIPEC